MAWRLPQPASRRGFSYVQVSRTGRTVTIPKNPRRKTRCWTTSHCTGWPRARPHQRGCIGRTAGAMLWRRPIGLRRLGPARYRNLIYFHEVDRGGHFAAWERYRTSPIGRHMRRRGRSCSRTCDSVLQRRDTALLALNRGTSEPFLATTLNQKGLSQMFEEINNSRRRFFGTAAMTIAAAQLGVLGSADAKTKPADLPTVKPGTNTSFAALKQIDAGLLNVGYAEAGPSSGPAVILLHGWPYDIYSFVDVAPLLASAGYRVIIPYLRGYGTTRFLSGQTLRNGQQSVVAIDIIALMDALNLQTAIIAGFDWGARTANIIAALWPERCKAMVSVSGYLIGSQASNEIPLS